MAITLISISHKLAPVEIREKYAADSKRASDIMRRLTGTDGIDEAIVLSTCGRMEVYMSGDPRICFESADRILGINDSRFFMRYQDEGAVRHLFLVASGLESQVIGEDQITGQVRDSYMKAAEGGYVGHDLHALFQAALTSAKRVKTDTDMSHIPVSTATIAVRAARDAVGDLSGKTVLLIGGTGKIGSIVLKDLSYQVKRIYVTSRNHKIRESEVIKPVDYADRYSYLDEADVVISATSSPHFTITKEGVMSSVRTVRRRIFIDMAVPMDIDPAIADSDVNSYLSIDDITDLAKSNNVRKEALIPEARDIVEKYMDEYLKGEYYRDAMEQISLLKKRIGNDEAIDKMVFLVRDNSTREELKSFLKVVSRINEGGLSG